MISCLMSKSKSGVVQTTEDRWSLNVIVSRGREQVLMLLLHGDFQKFPTQLHLLLRCIEKDKEMVR